MKTRVHVAFGAVATVAVVATLVWGFLLVGSPDTRRQQRMDERRLEDLQTIHLQIQQLVRDRLDVTALQRPLPTSLEELAGLARQQRLPQHDPETGEPYGYAVRGETVYELSATFTLPRDLDYEVFWNHPAGRHTFRIDALDPP